MRIAILLFVSYAWAITAIAQQNTQIYLVQAGSIEFASEAPLELIKAQSDQIKGAIDTSQNTFAFTVQMSSFMGFNSALQREHFCEKFLECDKNPKASFQGKLIEAIDYSRPGLYEVRAKGKLTVHGITQERIIRGNMKIHADRIEIESTFQVAVADHQIKIPRVVFEHIAKNIQVSIHALLMPSHSVSHIMTGNPTHKSPLFPVLRYWILSLGICLSVWALGQPISVTYSLPADLEIERFWQDRTGFVWVSGNSGFFRFDGMHWQKISLASKEVTVNCWYQHGDGSIWIGGQQGEIGKVIRNKIILEAVDTSLISSPVAGIQFDLQQRMWVATYGQGVFCFQDGQLLKQWLVDDGLSSNDIYAMKMDTIGNMWIGTDQGIDVFATTQEFRLIRHIGVQEGLPDPIVTELEVDQSSRIWACMYDGELVSFQNADASPQVEYQDSGIQFQHLFSRDSHVWATDADNTLRELSSTNIPSAWNLPSLPGKVKLIDREGNVWLQSPAKLELVPLHIQRLWSDLGAINAIEISNSDLWLGTDEGLWQASPKADRLVRIEKTREFRIASLYQDPNGSLWIGTIRNGAWRFDLASGQLIPIKTSDGKQYPHIISIAGNDTAIWLASFGGVYHHKRFGTDGGGIFHPEIGGKPIDYPYQVYTDEKSRIWLATDGQGLAVREEDEFRFVPQVGERTVFSIVQAADGRMWLCSEDSGLLAMHHDTLFSHPIDVSSRRLIPTSAIPLEDGRLILAHADGCGIYDPRLRAYVELGTAWNPRPVSAGLNSLRNDNRGIIWLGTEQGLLRIHPSIHRDARMPEARITELLINLEPAELHSGSSGEPLNLQADQRNLIIKFTGLWYQDPDQLRFQYRLRGADSTWIETRDNQAIFPQLGAGSYYFELKVDPPASSLPARISRLSFEISRPFWQQAWFILIASLVLAIVIRLWMHRREQSLTRRQQLEKQALSYRLETLRHQINPHFLFNSFTTLLGMIEEKSDRAAFFVEKLADLFRNVLDYRDRMAIPLREEKKLLDTYIALLKERFETGLQFEWEVPAQYLRLQVPPLCLQLLVENACKHNVISASRPLIIRISYIEPDMLLVSNNLQKRTNSPASTHIGLQNLVDRYRLLNEREIQVQITSDSYCVYLPLMKAREQAKSDT